MATCFLLGDWELARVASFLHSTAQLEGSIAEPISQAGQ